MQGSGVYIDDLSGASDSENSNVYKHYVCVEEDDEELMRRVYTPYDVSQNQQTFSTFAEVEDETESVLSSVSSSMPSMRKRMSRPKKLNKRKKHAQESTLHDEAYTEIDDDCSLITAIVDEPKRRRRV